MQSSIDRSINKGPIVSALRKLALFEVFLHVYQAILNDRITISLMEYAALSKPINDEVWHGMYSLTVVHYSLVGCRDKPTAATVKRAKWTSSKCYT